MNEVLRGASDRDNGQMSMSTDQRFAAVGSWVLILWGIGHNVVIDILPLAGPVQPVTNFIIQES